jgi:hypothetical protein
MQNKELIPLLCAGILFVIIIISVFSFNSHVPFISQTKSDTPVGEIYGEKQIGQTFFCDKDEMDRIDVLLATYARINSGKIIFHLRENTGNTDIRTITIDAKYVKDTKYHQFIFEPVEDSKNKSYEFYFTSPDSSPGNAITIWSTQENSYDGGDATINHKPIKGDLNFKVFHTFDTSDFLSIFFWRLSRDIPFLIAYFVIISILLLIILFVYTRK